MAKKHQVKGNGVAPAEIEDVLLGHPAVRDVAVVGVIDAYSGTPEVRSAWCRGRAKATDSAGSSRTRAKAIGELQVG